MRIQAKSIVAAVLCLGVVVAAGCGGYGEVSPAAYEHAKALYSITNRKASDQLPAMRSRIDDALAAGELTEKEADWLTNIVGDAASGEWSDANRQCRALMEDQVHAAKL